MKQNWHRSGTRLFIWRSLPRWENKLRPAHFSAKIHSSMDGAQDADLLQTSTRVAVLKLPPLPYPVTERLHHMTCDPARSKPSNPSRPIPHVGDAGEEEDHPHKRRESGCKPSFVTKGIKVCKMLVKVREGRVMRWRTCGKRFTSAFRLRMVRFASYISVAMTMMFPDSTRSRC